MMSVGFKTLMIEFDRNGTRAIKCPLETAQREIEASKRCLEDTIQAPVNSFAYPKGDYNQAVKSLSSRQVLNWQ